MTQQCFPSGSDRSTPYALDASSAAQRDAAAAACRLQAGGARFWPAAAAWLHCLAAVCVFRGRRGDSRRRHARGAPMGIEGYTRWLYEDHASCFAPAPPSSQHAFDHVYLDLNGHFHYWAYQAAKSEAHLIQLVYKDVDRILKLLGPRKSVVVAMDGPAPRAKLLTQRARRLRNEAKGKDGPAVDTALLSPGEARLPHYTSVLCYPPPSVQRGSTAQGWPLRPTYTVMNWLGVVCAAGRHADDGACPRQRAVPDLRTAAEGAVRRRDVLLVWARGGGRGRDQGTGAVARSRARRSDRQ